MCHTSARSLARRRRRACFMSDKIRCGFRIMGTLPIRLCSVEPPIWPQGYSIKLNDEYTSQSAQSMIRFKNPEITARLADALRRVGLPEGPGQGVSLYANTGFAYVEEVTQKRRRIQLRPDCRFILFSRNTR